MSIFNYSQYQSNKHEVTALQQFIVSLKKMHGYCQSAAFQSYSDNFGSLTIMKEKNLNLTYSKP